MRWRSTIGAGVLVMALAAGCSGGGDDATATAAATAAPPTATTAAATATASPAPTTAPTSAPTVAPTATTAATPAPTSAPATPAATTAPPPATTPAPATPSAVGSSISNFAFEAQITVAAGSTVTWKNADAAPHTVSATDGAFDSGTLNEGQSFSHTFEARGTFAYLCKIHPFMTGTVVVE